MANINANAASSLQSQLNRNISRLYQRFLAGDIESLELSDLLDDLIGTHAIHEALESA
ncbi:hypothetical protein C1752_10191 [Acaryochloris thomasi RCC1774]|uniref:Uncharacterized protein n=1 Tax=Acaryochloris thomasi RCC1774 TaxID=1764569 RepID=A0A2W1J9B9_9CYAN|nr:hypothetical protein [Acaryochloris thomasi]PZD70676.1 hypothetical protein C1752_10191 [Acaryochloris thomasi RCC1774]